MSATRATNSQAPTEEEFTRELVWIEKGKSLC